MTDHSQPGAEERSEEQTEATAGVDETPAEPVGSFGDAAAEMANETEVEAAESDVADAAAGPAEAGGPDGETAGAAGEPGGGDDAGADGGGAGEPSLERQLAERTADLQRLQAEYVNYKRRVDRDRELVRQNATYQALAPIIEVLDSIDRAREHGPLDNGFREVAEQLERVVAAQGLVKYGQPGDPFDPTIHEALSHIGTDPDVDVVTCKVVAKSGYRMGDRVVRVAQVLVVDPGERDEQPAHEM